MSRFKARLHKRLPLYYVLAWLLAGLLFLWPRPAQAATVSTCNESGLIDAITATPNYGTVTFSCSGTITLNTYATYSSGIVIGKNLTIDGAGQHVTISGGNNRRIFTLNPAYTLTLNHLTLTEGYAGIVGGAIYNFGGALYINNSTFSGNFAGNNGGAIYNHDAGAVTITNSTFSGNSAYRGGALSTTASATVTIINSTFYNNSGWAVFNYGGTVNMSHSIISGTNNCSGGGFADQGYNLSNDGTCYFTNTGSQNNVFNLNLGSLADNGGPTNTIALLPGSQAINAIPRAECVDLALNLVTTDQRGEPRRGNCDVGAYEYQEGTAILTSVPNPSVYGQTVSLTASFSSGMNIPTGTAIFKDGTTILGTAPLISGTASLAVSFTGLGQHLLNVDYSGDANYPAVISAASLTHTVNQVSTTTKLVVTPCGTVFSGQPVALTAIVTTPSGVASSGAVTFQDGATTLGTVSLVSGTATLLTTLSIPGTHAITVSYIDSAGNFDPSSDNLNLNIGSSPVTVSLATSANPSDYGLPVTFIVGVTATSAVPVGNVTFQDNVGTLGTVSLSNGVASLTTAALTPGDHNITATFHDTTGNFNEGTTNLIQTIRPTNTSLVVNSATGSAGGTVELKATLTVEANLLTGKTITFKINGNPVGSAITGTDGVATLTSVSLGGLAPGSYPISAVFDGDANYSPKSAASTLTVTGGVSTISINSGNNQSATVGQAFTSPLVVLVTDNFNNPVSGAVVTFTSPATGASAIVSATVTTGANGQANINAVANNIAGSYTVTASVTGVATQATFNLNNIAGVAASITVVSGNNQSTTVGQAFSNPLVVRVTDNFNNPVNGTTVTFVAPSSGASAVINGSNVTGSDGQLSVSAMANQISGTYSITASISSANQVSFTLTQQTTQTGSVTVQLLDSSGMGIANGSVRYFDVSWHAAGTTDNSGTLSFTPVNTSVTTITVEMIYGNGRRSIQQNIVSNPLVTFRTTATTLNLTNSSGSGLAGASVRYYQLSWQNFGTTGTDGKAVLELLPGTYSFEVTYNNGRQTKSNISVAAAPSYQVDFRTVVVLVRLESSTGSSLEGGTVRYYQLSWQNFGTTGTDGLANYELMPGTYSFEMTYNNGRQNLTNVVITDPVGGPVLFKTVATTVRLQDSQGGGLSGGTVRYYALSWISFGTIGLDGTVIKELLPGTYSFEMTYANGRQTKTNIVIAVETPMVIFSTLPVTVKLTDNGGTGVAGGVVRYYALSWVSFGTTSADGTVVKELLPGTYSFEMTYNGVKPIKSQDISTNPLVSFLTS